MNKVLPIGMENFRDLIRSNCYYVDKTDFIKTVMESGSKVHLITRPRRFGKTIFTDTLKSFLQIDLQKPGNTERNQALFAGLSVMKDRTFCDAFLGQYPVISMTLKDIEGEDFSAAYRMFAENLDDTIAPYSFLLTSPRLDERDKETLRNYLTMGYLKDPNHLDDAKNFLKNLTAWLSKHFERQTVVLIDEYDVPLAKAAHFGYYDKMLELIRAFLGQVLKEKPRAESDAPAYLKKAVLTGCLRVSKESIFTGINNPAINTVCSEDRTLNKVIGFTMDEVRKLLNYFGLTQRFEDVRQWYDGYRFAGEEMYCPWDVINFCDQAIRSGKPDTYLPYNYWDGTGGTDVIEEFLGFLSPEDADRMQVLVDGGSIALTINEKLTYSDFATHQSDDFWTLLLFTGYLTVESRLPTANSYRVRIPNKEIRDCFVKNVKARFSDSNREFVTYGRDLAVAALEGDADKMTEVIVPLLKNYISVRDTASKAPAENYYHGFLTALLSCAGSYAGDLRSNIEAGDGFADIAFTYGVGSRKVGVIIEIKRCEKPEDMYDMADNALRQIEEKRYTEYLDKLRCNKKHVFGIAFCRKDCAVTTADAE